MCERTTKTGATSARLCFRAVRKAESSYGITISRGDSASLRLGVFRYRLYGIRREGLRAWFANPRPSKEHKGIASRLSVTVNIDMSATERTASIAGRQGTSPVQELERNRVR